MTTVSGQAGEAIEEARKTYDPVIPQDGRVRVYPRNLYVDIQTTEHGRVGALRLQANLDDPTSVAELRSKLDEILDEATGG